MRSDPQGLAGVTPFRTAPSPPAQTPKESYSLSQRGLGRRSHNREFLTTLRGLGEGVWIQPVHPHPDPQREGSIGQPLGRDFPERLIIA
jgi:hypothetical protein